MRWTTGAYYLRRRDDPMVAVAGAWSMFYDCHGTDVPAVSGSYTTVDEPVGACAPPMPTFGLPPKGCKGGIPSGCISGNKGYTTFAEAWEACGIVAECGEVMRWTEEGRYYLRRLDDPDLEKAGAASIEYRCLDED